MNVDQSKKHSLGLREVGANNVLLTDAESRCFYVARDYQRKRLVRSLGPWEAQRWILEFQKLGWSSNGLIYGVQWLVLGLALVPMSVWLLLKCCVRLLLFPYRYLSTFLVPKDLKAPGEKTLVGLHNAFSRHLSLGASDYIACLNDWIRILYGEEKFVQNNLEYVLEAEFKKVKSQVQTPDEDISSALRSMVAVSREKLSKQLGHYLQPEQAH